MLKSVLIFVRPNKSSFPLVSARSRMVLNFHAATPPAPIFVKRLPQGLRCGDGSGAGANCRHLAQLMSADSAAPQLGQVIAGAGAGVGSTQLHSTEWGGIGVHRSVEWLPVIHMSSVCMTVLGVCTGAI